MHALRIIRAVCGRTWLKTVRRPVVLTFSFVQPIMWILFFGFLFHRFDVDKSPGAFGIWTFLCPVCAP